MLKVSPVVRIVFALFASTTLILAAAGMINLRMTREYDQLSLRFFNEQFAKPLESEIYERLSDFTALAKSISGDLGLRPNLRRQSSNYLDAEGAPPEDYDPEPALIALKRELAFLLESSLTTQTEYVKVRGISYILKGESQSDFTVWEDLDVGHGDLPHEIMSSVTGRKRAHRFLLPAYYWTDKGHPTMTVAAPVGLFDYSGNILVHFSLIEVLNNLDVRLASEIEFLNSEFVTVYKSNNISLPDDATTTEFLFPVFGPPGVTFGAKIEESKFEQLSTSFDHSERLISVLKVRADVSDLEEKLDNLRLRAFALFAFILISIALAANGLVVFLFKRVFDRQVAAEEEIQKSIRYAGRLQKAALLPKSLPEDLEIDIIWSPRDIVGGDLYFSYELEDCTVLSVIDCTGHGVPGGFLSAIAYSAFDRVVADKKWESAGELLTCLNPEMKKLLNQTDKTEAESDEGFDGAVCIYYHSLNKLSFAGAGSNLLISEPGKQTFDVKGNRKNIGSVRTKMQFEFDTHIIDTNNRTFTMFTDGVTDTMSDDPRPMAFGMKKVKRIVSQTNDKSPVSLNKEIIKSLKEHRGKSAIRDDLTLISFSTKSASE